MATAVASLRTRFPRVPTSGVVIGIIALFIFFSLSSPVFFSFSNFVNIGKQTTILALAAFAMTFVILSGEIDLSMGAVASLSGIFTAMAMRDAGITFPIAVLIGIAFGVAAGFVNGFITVRFRVPSFIVTLGIASIAQAVARTITDNRPVGVLDENFLTLFANANIGGIAVSILYAVVIFFALYLLLKRSTFGTSVYAVGGNVNAARLSGIPTGRVKILVFVLAGALVGIAGILQTARLGTAVIDPVANLELDAIAAVVLGGTSFTGGRGSLERTVLGILLIGLLNNGLALLNVDSYYQLVIKGAIVIAAVLLDRWSR
jgi:ribose/xylose/arabinose/galactoside ABC-type transport system permease subunit